MVSSGPARISTWPPPLQFSFSPLVQKVGERPSLQAYYRPFECFLSLTGFLFKMSLGIRAEGFSFLLFERPFFLSPGVFSLLICEASLRSLGTVYDRTLNSGRPASLEMDPAFRLGSPGPFLTSCHSRTGPHFLALLLSFPYFRPLL